MDGCEQDALWNRIAGDMTDSASADFGHRPLRARELLSLVLSAWGGTVLTGFAAIVFTGSPLRDQATSLGTLVLLLALLPVLVALVPGVLLQTAAAPSCTYDTHVRLSFVAGVLYLFGWLTLVPLTSVADRMPPGSPVSALAAALAWAYWLAGPLLWPMAIAIIHQKRQQLRRDG